MTEGEHLHEAVKHEKHVDMQSRVRKGWIARHKPTNTLASPTNSEWRPSKRNPRNERAQWRSI